jgi:hypothetical protein
MGIQHVKATSQCTVNPKKVLEAMKWLIDHSYKYKDCKLPAKEDLPKPLVIDHLTLFDGADPVKEGKYKYQVVFPEPDDVAVSNGGWYKNRAEFKEKVIEDLDAVNNVDLISRPTTKHLKDYEGRQSHEMLSTSVSIWHGVIEGQESKMAKTHHHTRTLSTSIISC